MVLFYVTIIYIYTYIYYHLCSTRITYVKREKKRKKEARCFKSTAFPKYDVLEKFRISKILFWKHNKSEGGHELSRMGLKHDGKPQVS